MKVLASSAWGQTELSWWWSGGPAQVRLGLWWWTSLIILPSETTIWLKFNRPFFRSWAHPSPTTRFSHCPSFPLFFFVFFNNFKFKREVNQWDHSVLLHLFLPVLSTDIVFVSSFDENPTLWCMVHIVLATTGVHPLSLSLQSHHCRAPNLLGWATIPRVWQGQGIEHRRM